MSMIRKGLLFAVSIIIMPALLLRQIPVMATEGDTETAGSAMLPTIKEEIISVDLPAVREESPFDFYIDPRELLYVTGAARHGGGVVEKVHIFFSIIMMTVNMIFPGTVTGSVLPIAVRFR